MLFELLTQGAFYYLDGFYQAFQVWLMIIALLSVATWRIKALFFNDKPVQLNCNLHEKTIEIDGVQYHLGQHSHIGIIGCSLVLNVKPEQQALLPAKQASAQHIRHIYLFKQQLSSEQYAYLSFLIQLVQSIRNAAVTID